MPLGDIAQAASRGFKAGAFGESLASQSAASTKQEMMKAQLSEILGIQDDRRMQAMAMDLRKTNFFLKNKQPDQAVNLLQNRISQIKKAGKDPKETQALLDKIQGGDDSVLNDLATAETGFVLSGQLDPINQQQKQALGMMERPEIKQFFETEEGLLGVTKTGEAREIALPEGVRIKEKKSPLAEAIAGLQLETAKLRQQQLKGQITEKQEQVKQARINKKEGFYNELDKLSPMIGTMEDLLEGDVLEQSAGWQSMFPTVPGSPVASFQSQLETMKSQLFLKGVSQLKGMGALSEAEGRKIAEAVGSLDIGMGDKLLRKEITRIQKDIFKAVKRTENKIRAGKFSLPEGYTPISDITDAQITELQRARPDLTPEQIRSLLSQ